MIFCNNTSLKSLSNALRCLRFAIGIPSGFASSCHKISIAKLLTLLFSRSLAFGGLRILTFSGL
jgi:hypothetical protein